MTVLSLRRVIEVLDPDKTYVVGVIAPKGVLGRLKFGQDCCIPPEDRWVHSGVLFFDGDWRYVDADLQKGVIEVAWNSEVEKCGPDYRFEAFEWPIDVSAIRALVGTPFSKDKMAALDSLCKRGFEPDDRGVTCGEIVAMAGQMSDPVTMRSVDLQMLGRVIGVQDVGTQ